MFYYNADVVYLAGVVYSDVVGEHLATTTFR